MLRVYVFKVEAVRERFMEPPIHATSEHYIAAYSYDQAHSHVWANFERAGWKVEKITSEEVYVQDIRDSCDHITD